MAQVPQIVQDLEFVRAAVERNDRRPPPLSIYWFWGVATLVGFAMVDFRPTWSGVYWAIVGPLGGIGGGLLARRYVARHGAIDRREWRREAAHWVGMFVALVLVGVGASAGSQPLPSDGVARVTLLIVAYTYYMAWVRRGDRILLAGGLVMAGGYVALAFAQAYVWTAAGALVFLALAGGSTLEALGHRRHAHE